MNKTPGELENILVLEQYFISVSLQLLFPCFFSVSNAISVPQMQLQVIPGHFAKCCCRKQY